MYAQCPECRAVYRVNAELLAAAEGDVTCGRCGEIWCALLTLSDQHPGDGPAEMIFPGERPPLLRETAEPPRAWFSHDSANDEDGWGTEPWKDEDLVHGAGPDPAGAPGDEDLSPARGAADRERTDATEPDLEPLLGAMPRARVPARSRTGAWVLGSVLLSGLLAGQFLWQHRDALLAHPDTRPLLADACALLGCRLPLRRDLRLLRLVSRDIRPHPSVEGALIINATLHNTADHPQAYPDVQILLSDLQGAPVAGRAFQPEEYLEASQDPAAGMPARTLVPLVFEVVDPGPEAVAFEFAFR